MTISPARIARHLADGVRHSTLLHPQDQDDRNTRLLYLNTAMVGVASGGIMAFLSIFMARLGAGPTLLSWLTSAPALLAIIALVPGAVIAERNPDQVRVRVRAAQLVRGSYLLCAAAPFVVPAPYLPLVLVVIWTIKTLPDAVAITAWTAVVARAVSPERRARLNGTRWALLSLVSAASSAFFGWLLDSIAFPLNYQLVFLLSAVLAGLDPYFFSFIRVPPSPPPALPPRGPLLPRAYAYFRPVVLYRPFVVFLAATLLYRVALNMPAPLFSLFWVKSLQASDMLIGLRGTVGNAALVVGYLFWGRSANRLGHRKVLTLCALAYALYPVLTALSPSAIWLLPVACLWGLAAGGIDVGLFDLMLASCPQERQPLFAAVWSMVANSAVFVGPLLGAAISGATSISTALIVAGVLQVLATIPFLALPGDV
jgi:MFS family permease